MTDPYTGEQVEAPEITLVADSGKKARVVLFNIFAGKVGYKIAVHGGGGCICPEVQLPGKHRRWTQQFDELLFTNDQPLASTLCGLSI